MLRKIGICYVIFDTCYVIYVTCQKRWSLRGAPFVAIEMIAVTVLRGFPGLYAQEKAHAKISKHTIKSFFYDANLQNFWHHNPKFT